MAGFFVFKKNGCPCGPMNLGRTWISCHSLKHLSQSRIISSRLKNNRYLLGYRKKELYKSIVIVA